MQFPKDYPMTIAVALAMNLHCYCSAWSVSKARKQIFNREFMEKEFGLLHRSQMAEEIDSGGHPDAGNGLYANKLSYKDWYRFNVLQRIHMNYIENLSFATVSTLAAGLYDPKIASCMGLVFLLGRLLYSSFYDKKEGFKAKLKKAGALLSLIGLFFNTALFANHYIKNYLTK